MSDDIDGDRRRFLGTAAMTLAATRFGASRLGAMHLTNASAHMFDSPGIDTNESATPASFKPIKQIDAGVLNVGYAEDGPVNGPPVILLHGWPYDIHSYADVAPL